MIGELTICSYPLPLLSLFALFLSLSLSPFLSLSLSLSAAYCALSTKLQAIYVRPRLAAGRPELHEDPAVSLTRARAHTYAHTHAHTHTMHTHSQTHSMCTHTCRQNWMFRHTHDVHPIHTHTQFTVETNETKVEGRLLSKGNKV